MTIYTVSIALNVFGVGITFLLLILAAISLNVKQRVQLCFFLNVVLLALNFVMEIVISFLLGRSGPAIGLWLRILNCISYSIAGFSAIAFALYLYEYLSSKTAPSKNPFFIMMALGVVITLMAVIAFATDLYITFDKYNNMVQQSTFWTSEVCLILFVLLCLWTIFRYIKILRPQEWVPLTLFALTPLLCYSLELMIPGLYVALLGGSCTMALIYVTIQVDLKHQWQLKEIELKESRMAIMLSQIQPHFLYNSLTAIEYLCIIDGSEQAATAVRDFSKYLRGNMDSITYKDLIPFEKELQHVDLYLSLEKRRFGDLIQTRYDTPALAFALPPLTLQPLVENAVRHGIAKRETGGVITIRTEEDKSFWRIIVLDDGVGFDTAAPKSGDRAHIGIANVRSRLETLCAGQLIITSAPGLGTTATILIPKR